MQADLTAPLAIFGFVALIALAIPGFKLWLHRKKGNEFPSQRRLTPEGPVGVRKDYAPLGIDLDLDTALMEQWGTGHNGKAPPRRLFSLLFFALAFHSPLDILLVLF
jgi:hypothetical protein